MFKYFPHTKQDINHMLKVIQKPTLDSLFDMIPAEIKKHAKINLSPALTEFELIENMSSIANKNLHLEIYRGAGAYDHYTPSIIPYLVQRSEFLTSYTPYQPEISQGTLQYIFEFQSMITRLTGLDIANASMYDGATSTAEAVLMSVAQTRKDKVLVSSTMNPSIVDVIKTYAKYQNIEIIMIPEINGETNLNFIKSQEDYASVVVQNPNYYGLIEDYSNFRAVIDEANALFVMNNDPSTLSVIKSPKELGVDIATGDGQSLGIPLSFGGPYVGYMATTKKLMRRLPGRIVGATKDLDGKRGFVLTLQAREQHIRRSRATSNICSNQSLMALWTTIYLSVMGHKGLLQVNELSYTNAHYLQEKLIKTGHFEKVHSDNFIKEFVVKTKVDAYALEKKLIDKGYLFGLPLDKEHILIAVTEKTNFEKIDKLVEVLAHVL